MARGRNARRRRIGWTVAALAAAAVLSAALLLKTDDPPAPQPADAEALIDRFEKVAFRYDSVPEHRQDLFRSRLYRWERPVRLSFRGVESAIRLHFLQFIEEIELLAGRRVWEVPQDSVTPANVLISKLPNDEYRKVFTSVFPTNGLRPSPGIDDVQCFVTVQDYQNNFDENIISIQLSPITSYDDYRYCVLEEVLQGLGLLADTVEEFDSLFIERGAWRLDFPLNDKILLRTLYDRRLRAGMKREEAMAKVALIIPELLAAYEAEGVAGLYQPLHDPRW